MGEKKNTVKPLDQDFSFVLDGRDYLASEEEMMDPSLLLNNLQATGYFVEGPVKVIPPPSYVPTTKTPDAFSKDEVKQPYNMRVRSAGKGYYVFTPGPRGDRKITVGDLMRNNETHLPKRLKNASIREIERAYWTEIEKKGSGSKNQVLCTYGTDEEGTCFSFGSQKLSLCQFPSLLSDVQHKYHYVAPGLTVPFMYYGQWRTTFVNHTEDDDLYAISFLHYGAPKVWYATAPADAGRVDQLVGDDVKACLRLGHECNCVFRHKKLLVHPQHYKDNNITLYRFVQRQGEFIVVPPLAYHFGFNVSFNVAEAVNYAANDWIPFGLLAKRCPILDPTINLEFYVYEKMFDKYDDYLRGTLMIPHPLTGEMMQVEKPNVDVKSVEAQYTTCASDVSEILAVRTVDGVEQVYVKFDAGKIWLRREEVEGKLKWDKSKASVKIPDYFFAKSAKPPPVIVDGVVAERIQVTRETEQITCEDPTMSLPEPPSPCEGGTNVMYHRTPESSSSSISVAVPPLCIRKTWQCPTCDKDLMKVLTKNRNRNRHIIECASKDEFICRYCSVIFKARRYLNGHLKRCSKNPDKSNKSIRINVECAKCGKSFKEKRYLGVHLKICKGRVA